MSTYYYLGCELCKKQIPFWSRYAGGPCIIPSAKRNPETVQDFLEEHITHEITVYSEYDDRAYNYYDTLDDHPYYNGPGPILYYFYSLLGMGVYTGFRVNRMGNTRKRTSTQSLQRARRPEKQTMGHYYNNLSL